MSFLVHRRALWFAVSIALHALLLAGFYNGPETRIEPMAKSTASPQLTSIAMQTQLIVEPQYPPPPVNTENNLLTGQAPAKISKPEETRTLNSPDKPEPSIPAPTEPDTTKPEPNTTEPIETVPLQTLPTPEPEIAPLPLNKLNPVPIKPVQANEEPLPPLAEALSVEQAEPVPVQDATSPAEQTNPVEALSIGVDKGTSAELVRGPLPPYPHSARNAEISGVTTILSVKIDARGKSIEVELVRSSGHSGLDRSALNTVKRKWQFKPARNRQNEAIPSYEQIAIEWQLH